MFVASSAMELLQLCFLSTNTPTVVLVSSIEYRDREYFKVHFLPYVHAWYICTSAQNLLCRCSVKTFFSTGRFVSRCFIALQSVCSVLPAQGIKQFKLFQRKGSLFTNYDSRIFIFSVVLVCRLGMLLSERHLSSRQNCCTIPLKHHEAYITNETPIAMNKQLLKILGKAAGDFKVFSHLGI